MPKLIHISKRQECGEVIECGAGGFSKVLVGECEERVWGERGGQRRQRLDSVGRVVWGESVGRRVWARECGDMSVGRDFSGE